MLRLFNDCFAMLFLYISILFWLNNQWNIGCIFYRSVYTTITNNYKNCDFLWFSLGVSVKMNIFLFAPALFGLLIERFGFLETVKKISLCALIQVCFMFCVKL